MTFPLLRVMGGLGLVALLLLAGCAKFPAGGGSQNPRLIVTMTVAGRIKNSVTDPNLYIYIVAMNPSIELFPTAQGPVPVVAPPWGNGFVAGNATHFVRFGVEQAAPYTVYKFTAPDLQAWGATGVPVNYTVPAPTESTIRFEIDLSQIAPTGIDPNTLQSVQINFLTMDIIRQGNDPGPRFWDAFGNSASPNSVNDYVRIPLTASRVFTNADFQDLEVQGDTPDPDLDIINWSVEVVRP